MEGESEMKSALRFVRADLLDLKYHGVDSILEISKAIGIPVDQIVKLDANENVYGPPLAVTEAIQRADFHIYPDPAQRRFRDAVAKFHQVDADCVVGGSGSDDILEIIIRVTAPKKILICTPTFGMYSFLGKMQRAEIIDVPRMSGSFEIDLEKVIQTIQDEGVNLFFVASPNNPTGNAISEEALRRLCDLECVIVLDEAYADFRDDAFSSIPLLAEYPNLIIIRTLSKWAGLAGLRVGYSVCDRRIAAVMMSAKQPYNINCSAEVAAIAAFENYESIRRSTLLPLIAERTRLHHLLTSLPWILPSPSQANFVLARVAGGHSALSVRNYLRRKGILIRYFGTQGGALSDYIRISSGRSSDIDRVVTALKEYTSPKAMIFDMDGVLVDVSSSYNTAILQTAHSFGALITYDDITAAKLQGNANNDWVLTHRLIQNYPNKEGSPVPSYEVVKETFESLYQGELYKSERLVVSRDVFENLKAKGIHLGIVTGRPRRDAYRFLDEHQLTSYFESIVCMGDTSLPKPSPDPILLCLKQIGVTEAAMIGDTVDDVRASVAAGVIAFGVVAPGSTDPEKEAEALRGSGAASVFAEGLRDLPDYPCFNS